MNIDLIISDVDGTLIDSNESICLAQASTIARESPLNIEEAKKEISCLGLNNTINQYLNISTDEFFTRLYKTFNPYEEIKKGNLRMYNDARKFVSLNYEKIPIIAISNSSQRATEAKFNALGIAPLFRGIYAAIQKCEAKPNLTLAERAFWQLKKEGIYSPKDQLIVIGDRDIDVQFGHNIKEMHKNTTSILIDRGQDYSGIEADVKISSFLDLYYI